VDELIPNHPGIGREPQVISCHSQEMVAGP